MQIKKIKNKKAIVLPEVLNIIIAVACIILLFYLATKLYGIFTRSSELEQAKASVEAIAGKASVLKAGENLNYLILGPEGWYLFYFKDNNILNSCNKKSCVCICPSIFSSLSDSIKDCDSKGRCKNIPSLDFSSKCLKESSSGGGIIGDLNAFYLDNCLSLEKLPISLSIEDSNGKIKLSLFAGNNLDETLTSLLNFKLNEQSSSIKESTINFISLREKNKVTTITNPWPEELLSARDFLQNSIKAFFNSKKIDYWIFRISDSVTKENYLELNGAISGSVKYTSPKSTTVSYNNKDYEVSLALSS